MFRRIKKAVIAAGIARIQGEGQGRYQASHPRTLDTGFPAGMTLFRGPAEDRRLCERASGWVGTGAASPLFARGAHPVHAAPRGQSSAAFQSMIVWVSARDDSVKPPSWATSLMASVRWPCSASSSTCAAS